MPVVTIDPEQVKTAPVPTVDVKPEIKIDHSKQVTLEVVPPSVANPPVKVVAAPTQGTEKVKTKSKE